MSFLSKDPLVLDNQLKVQSVAIKLGDQFVSTSGVTVTANLGESIKEVRSAIHINDSGAIALVSQANLAISGSSVTATLGEALASGDCLLLHYVISE